MRIGEKKATQSGGSRPAAVDYFLSDDPLFAELTGDKPQAITVAFPYADQEDNFSTGFEWWVKGKSQKNVLACYTKDGEKALRMDQMVNPDDERLPGEKTSGGRVPITCRFRGCPIFKRGDCKPMGRLIFWLDGAPRDSVYELDTKSWNSIEKLTAAFNAIGDPRGRSFTLSVSFHTEGANRFPVLALTEVPVVVNSPADADKADALLALDAALSTDDELILRTQLALTLDVVSPGWKDKPAVIAKIKEVGVEAAAKSLLAKQLA